MKNNFSYEALAQASNEGTQAYLNGKPFICPYASEEALALRVRWINAYNSARNQQPKNRTKTPGSK